MLSVDQCFYRLLWDYPLTQDELKIAERKICSKIWDLSTKQPRDRNIKKLNFLQLLADMSTIVNLKLDIPSRYRKRS